MMAITKQSYKDLKEYWDYQRKVEYNKEVVHYMADKFEGRVYNDFGMVLIQMSGRWITSWRSTVSLLL